MSAVSQTLNQMPWIADYDRVVAAAGAVAKSLKKHASLISVIGDLWKANRKFKVLLLDLRKITNAQREDLVDLLSKLRSLNGCINDILGLAKKYGYRNRTLSNACFHALEKQNIELLDFIETFGLSLRADLDELTKQALAEYQQGETVSLESALG